MAAEGKKYAAPKKLMSERMRARCEALEKAVGGIMLPIIFLHESQGWRAAERR